MEENLDELARSWLDTNKFLTKEKSVTSVKNVHNGYKQMVINRWL